MGPETSLYSFQFKDLILREESMDITWTILYPVHDDISPMDITWTILYPGHGDIYSMGITWTIFKPNP